MSVADSGLARLFVANEHPPKITIRYFYVSQLDLDDTLSPTPIPSSTTTPRLPPRPLSEHDSTAVDKAWNELRGNIRKYHEDMEKRIQRKTKEPTPQSSPSLPALGASRPMGISRDRSTSKRSSRILDDVTQESSPKDWQPSPRRATMSNADGRHVIYAEESDHSQSLRSNSAIETSFDIGESSQGTTGTPFVRAPTRRKRTGSLRGGRESSGPGTPESGRPTARRQLSLTSGSAKGSRIAPSLPVAKVPVGASRLHQVALPSFNLEPIYWLPVNDVTNVIRGTWFYKDSVFPVETDIANLLEAGYAKLRPWTNTWKDELNSAVRAGPAGEEKIVHPLWPQIRKEKSSSRPGTSLSSTMQGGDETQDAEKDRATVAACEIINASTAQLSYDNKAAGKNSYGNDGVSRIYKKAGVIYANDREAYLLKPNTQPSAYYGRKPLADYIRKGRSIGTSVIRGFSSTDWERMHPRKGSKSTQSASLKMSNPESNPTDASQQMLGVAIPPTSPQVTDLVLVIHGIGQKLSERVESYNFTYAMNSFRREFNVQLRSNTVKPLLRKSMGNAMVLPVNWRSMLSFEEGGYRDEPTDTLENPYTLKDITPDSLPNVRNIVSDVMLDIPYYLSHHQPRMIQAVINEANRIYSLWCENNPGFDKWGRVHVIAHSLGSVMAIDILSKQPTRVDVTPATTDESEQGHFAFNTSNLFLCGSPAGFFLLLKKAGLRPRTAHEKLQSTQNDTDFGVGDEAGTYGCIAVDNVYNVLNPYDPVSYQLNAAVDTAYAGSLKLAMIPSASTSWFAFGGSGRSGYSRVSTASRKDRPELTHRFPSNVELETHNFTREEIAEKRAFLLNDNGQIDFFLRYGGGPLEIQYLTILGAHSSYWTSNDFIRFLAIEIGREPGREGALEALKAIKRKAVVS